MIVVQVEGVGPDGRMFLFKQPSLEDQNATLWNMYYSMKMEKEALRKKLDYEVRQSPVSVYNVGIQVEALKRKKEKMFQWNLALSNREFSVESSENSVHNLKRECRIKDALLADKDTLIAQKDKTIAEIVSANQGEVNSQIEVCANHQS